ncbi:RHS repeat domain-containing protein, partial [Alteromonas sp. a30]|uniref:RHS repeat domain-containing protein n=1 Tax=Alteromonas sp. a30 TaxID=2730917 RepID=UPI002DDCC9C2
EYLYHGVTGQMLSTKVQIGATSPLHHLAYNAANAYDSFGNLKVQSNEVTHSQDSFTYDALHRLTQSGITVNGQTASIDYGYDAVGNLTKKSDYSENSANAYSYTTGTNKISSIRLKDDAGTVSFGYDNKGNQTLQTVTSSTGNAAYNLTYDVFNKPLTIHKNGSDITLAYGADLARYKQIRVVQEDGQEKTITTHYIGKHYEVEIDESGNRERKTYLGDLAIITDSDREGMHISYTHRDRLGSAATFTNAQNNVTARRHFDAFGKPRNGDWSQLESLSLAAQLGTNLLDTSMTTRRGFTDHEHLDEAELIHMNGRVYDYNVGRFMSVDPVIQSPANTQSVNPYSYIMNNPMSGTDPTGYESCPQGQECAKVATTGTRIPQAVEASGNSLVGTSSGIKFNGSFGGTSNGAQSSGQTTPSADKPQNNVDVMGQEQVSSTPPPSSTSQSPSPNKVGVVEQVQQLDQIIVDAIRDFLPIFADNHPVSVAIDVRDQTVEALAANSLDLETVVDVASNVLAKKVRQAKGVVTKGGGQRKFMEPIEDADGSHTVWKKNNKGEVTNHQTFKPNTNPKNPNKWMKGNRTDVSGKSEFNKKTKRWVDTPHTHDSSAPGGIRPARPDELPK